MAEEPKKEQFYYIVALDQDIKPEMIKEYIETGRAHDVYHDDDQPITAKVTKPW